MESSISYLQALPKNEAIAFISSLQKVRVHLNQELQWLNEQLEHKTVQFQGIETMLAEASQLGVATPNSDAAVLPVSVMSGLAASPEVEAPASSDPDSPSTPAQSKSAAKSAAGKTSATSKASKAKPKKSAQPPKAAAKKSQPRSPSDLRHFLKSQFQEQTFTDSVAEILGDAAQPLHLDDLIDQLYGQLSDQTFQRAKVSIANVLSTGTQKGKWKSLGQGFYAANSAATV